MSWAICQNAECGNYEWPIEVNLTVVDEESGEERTITTVICGVCGQQITEVVDVKPPDPVDPDADIEA